MSVLMQSFEMLKVNFGPINVTDEGCLTRSSAFSLSQFSLCFGIQTTVTFFWLFQAHSGSIHHSTPAFEFTCGKLIALKIACLLGFGSLVHAHKYNLLLLSEPSVFETNCDIIDRLFPSFQYNSF